MEWFGSPTIDWWGSVPNLEDEFDEVEGAYYEEQE